MNKKLDHLETSVRQLKRDSKILKDQNEHPTKQVNELKSTVSKLESQNKEQEMKTKRLEAQSRRENLRFMGLIILEDLKVLKRSPDLLINVKIGYGQLRLIIQTYFVLPYMGMVAILVKYHIYIY